MYFTANDCFLIINSEIHAHFYNSQLCLAETKSQTNNCNKYLCTNVYISIYIHIYVGLHH